MFFFIGFPSEIPEESRISECMMFAFIYVCIHVCVCTVCQGEVNLTLNQPEPVRESRVNKYTFLQIIHQVQF